MTTIEMIDQLLKLAESTTFSGEREAALKKVEELSSKIQDYDTISKSSKDSKVDIKLARETFVKAIYPWYLDEIPEGYAPCFFYPYLQDEISRKCKKALDQFPDNKRLAKAYQDLNFLISDHCEDYIYYERAANLEYYGDYFIIMPAELVFWLTPSYDKEGTIKGAFEFFEQHKKKFFERLESGEFDDNILYLSKRPLLEV